MWLSELEIFFLKKILVLTSTCKTHSCTIFFYWKSNCPIVCDQDSCIESTVSADAFTENLSMTPLFPHVSHKNAWVNTQLRDMLYPSATMKIDINTVLSQLNATGVWFKFALVHWGLFEFAVYLSLLLLKKSFYAFFLTAVYLAFIPLVYYTTNKHLGGVSTTSPPRPGIYLGPGAKSKCRKYGMLFPCQVVSLGWSWSAILCQCKEIPLIFKWLQRWRVTWIKVY